MSYLRKPVYIEIIADFETPLSCYLKLANAPYTYLLESVQGGEKWGRYSVIGMPCKKIIKVYDHEIQIWENGQIISTNTVEDPLAWLEEFQQQFQVMATESLPPFTGGLVGYFGYDTVRYVESRLAHTQKKEILATPDILLMVSEDVLVFDNLLNRLFLITHINPEEPEAESRAYEQLKKWQNSLTQSFAMPEFLLTKHTKEIPLPTSNISETDYLDGVEKIKEYLAQGDAMQVVYSQRFSMPYTESPFQLYRAIRHLNPSPYLYYFNLDDFHIVGSSPEILLKVENRIVTVRPLAGTRKRGRNLAEDQQLSEELLNDQKEIAEHLMLIDLGRNDIGKISTTGSVKVLEQMAIERYSHVMHIVSEVQSELLPELSVMDALKATLPAGTLSGAPKVRAMEIIDELEPDKRGIYGGAVGYLGWQGQVNTAIAIRTGIIQNGVLYIQAGAGIVYDSIPEQEWQECINKAKAMLQAAELAAQREN